eukprot:723145-Pleurochrysis_carterae.AAC.3
MLAKVKCVRQLQRAGRRCVCSSKARQSIEVVRAFGVYTRYASLDHEPPSGGASLRERTSARCLMLVFHALVCCWESILRLPFMLAFLLESRVMPFGSTSGNPLLSALVECA